MAGPKKTPKKTETPPKVEVFEDTSPPKDPEFEHFEPVQRPQKTKVAIVGSANTSLDMTPWDDPEFEIWVLAWRKVPRCDRRFDIHEVDDPKRMSVPKNYKEILSEMPVPVYLTKKHREILSSVRYPLEDIMDFLGRMLDPYADGDYFASSIAYMLALAMYEGWPEIHLYGVDLLADEEYSHQRPNTEYLIGIARGRGHKVYIPKTSALLKFGYRYGYDPKPSFGPITSKILKERIKAYRERRDKANAEAHTADGALQEAEQLANLLKFTERGGQVKGLVMPDPAKDNKHPMKRVKGQQGAPDID